MKVSFPHWIVLETLAQHLKRKGSDPSAVIDSEQYKELTNAEFIKYLKTEHSKGHQVVPATKGCGKPCKNSRNCPGFDYQTGCPGYEKDELFSKGTV